MLSTDRFLPVHKSSGIHLFKKGEYFIIINILKIFGSYRLILLNGNIICREIPLREKDIFYCYKKVL